VSQDRILGSATTVSVYGPNGPTPFGELDAFNDEPGTTEKNWHPLGQVEDHQQLVYKGYKLTFKLGKIDDSIENIQQSLDAALVAGQSAPRYRIVNQTTWYSGNVETWIYDNALIYGLKDGFANAEDAIGQDLTGWSARKDRG
jgi:hypothetical protein